MDTFPPIKVQLLWILVLSALSMIAYRVIRVKKLCTITKTPSVSVNLKDILISFGFYLMLSLLVVPVAFQFMKNLYLKAPIETISLFQLFFMTFVAGFLVTFIKIRKFKLFEKPENYFEILLKSLLYLAVIFPIVSLIGQLSDTFLFLAFDVQGYQQLAVLFLKKTIGNPIALTSSMISIVILAPLVEELLFRGLLLNFLKNRFGMKTAVIASGILFAIFHFSQSQGLGNLSLLLSLSYFGMMLAVFYLMTSSLIYPMMLHAIFNLLSTLRILFFDI